MIDPQVIDAKNERALMRGPKIVGVERRYIGLIRRTDRTGPSFVHWIGNVDFITPRPSP
jgi:hypothetical protein